ncbi:MAG: tRNA-dihydrouridine synthase, partial [Phycisphaerales bacterium]|nr:tRNA-dihydrouridine synthase [Phycisphaerales bacterium]
QVGIAAITVHGRTTEQFFKGRVRLDGIRAVVEAVASIPVIGNGDVRCGEDAARMMAETGCDAVMVARGALGRPWIFREIHARLAGDDPPPPPDRTEWLRIIERHLDLILEHQDERAALHRLRSGISRYAKGMHGVKRLKEQVRSATSAAEIRSTLRQQPDSQEEPAPASLRSMA